MRILFHSLRTSTLIVTTTCLMGAMTGMLQSPTIGSVRLTTQAVPGSGFVSVTNNHVLTTATFGFGKMNGVGGAFNPQNEMNCQIDLLMVMVGTRTYRCTKDLPAPPWLVSDLNWGWGGGRKPDYVARLQVAESGAPLVVKKSDTDMHTVNQLP